LEEDAAMELSLKAQSFMDDFCVGVDFDDAHNAEVLFLSYVSFFHMKRCHL
jgi:hypothetical protein